MGKYIKESSYEGGILMKERPLTILTFVVLLFTGVTAMAGGISLMLDRYGDVIGIPLNLLYGSSFSNYLIPGLLLFGVIGIGSLAAALILWKKAEISWVTTMLAGVALVIWIIVQVSIIGYVSKLQPIMFIIGVLEFVLGFSYIKFVKMKYFSGYKISHKY